MLSSWTTRVLLTAMICAGAAGCDDETPTSPNPTPVNVTETFTGTIGQNGAQTHQFSTVSSGTVTATLRALAPDSALVVGLSLGNWNGTACQIVLANDAATVSAVLTGTVSAAGNLCLRVHDVGNISNTPAAYTVEVVHP